MSDEKSLVPAGASTVAMYGESEDVHALQDRIMVMLPQVAKIGKAAAYGLAQVSLAMGLNPFIGEIWAIPASGGGYSISGGIKGIRRSAHREAKKDGGMYTVRHRLPRAEEIEGLIVNKGDIVRACDVIISGRRAKEYREFVGEVPRFTGIGVYRKGESTRMNPLQCVRKRAEADALKQAYDLPLAYADQNGGEVDFIEPSMDDVDYVPNGASEVAAPQAVDELFGDYPADGDQPVAGDYVEEPNGDEPPPEAAEQNTAPNWVNDPDVTRRVYAWLADQKLPNGETISKGQFYEIIGVTSSLKEFTGTVGDVKTLVRKWIKDGKAKDE